MMKINIVRLFKEWTLAFAMITGVSGYFLFANIPILTAFGNSIKPITDAFLPVLMFIILFVTFCKVDFSQIKLVKWHGMVATAQVILVSLLMLPLLLWHWSLPTKLLLQSLVACTIAPCASASAVVTQKLGGSIEEMTTFTFLGNILSALLIPICFPLISTSVTISFADTFSKILYEVAVILLLPMAAAYVVKHYFKVLHKRIVSIKDLSYYLWALSLVMVTGSTMKNIMNANTGASLLLKIALCSLILCFIMFGLGRKIGKHYEAVIESGQALGQKNTVFAIWASYSYLYPIASIGPGCYILWQNIINSIEIWAYRKKRKRS